MNTPVPFADNGLARRIERAEATSAVRNVEARARVSPERGATWIEVAGAYAMFDGPQSPVTQTFGLGLFRAPTAHDFEALEAFFEERGAAVYHEVSPLADAATLTLLNARGYQPIEFTSMMYRGIGGREGRDGLEAQGGTGNVLVRRAGAEDAEVFARTAAEGWREAGFADFVYDMARVYAASDGLDLFLAEIDGRAIATGVLSMHEGVAHLAGASTIPDGRRRGAQNALLDRRLRFAAGRGCDLALIGALPGSGSQRNAERHGFRIAYTRVKWQKK
jgi:acetyltransferase (GNAT) family protein